LITVATFTEPPTTIFGSSKYPNPPNITSAAVTLPSPIVDVALAGSKKSPYSQGFTS
jgi:hypothetical protein